MSNLFICQELIDDPGTDFSGTQESQAIEACGGSLYFVPCSDNTDSANYYPDPSYATTIQHDIAYISYREQVYSWLMEFAEERRSPATVVFMATNYFDRVLSQKVVAKEQLELVSLLCFYLASTVIERIDYQFTFNKLLYFFSGRYDSKAISSLLHEIISLLEFRLNVPSPFVRLNQITQKCHLEHLYPKAYSYLKAICRSYDSIHLNVDYLAIGALYAVWYMENQEQIPESLLQECYISLGSFYEITSILRNQNVLTLLESSRIYSMAQANRHLAQKHLESEEKVSKPSPTNILTCLEQI